MTGIKHIYNACMLLFVLYTANSFASVHSDTSIGIKKYEQGVESRDAFLACNTSKDVEGILEPSIRLQESNIPDSHGFKTLCTLLFLLTFNSFSTVYQGNYIARRMKSGSCCPLFIFHRHLII